MLLSISPLWVGSRNTLNITMYLSALEGFGINTFLEMFTDFKMEMGLFCW